MASLQREDKYDLAGLFYTLYIYTIALTTKNLEQITFKFFLCHAVDVVADVVRLREGELPAQILIQLRTTLHARKKGTGLRSTINTV